MAHSSRWDILSRSMVVASRDDVCEGYLIFKASGTGAPVLEIALKSENEVPLTVGLTLSMAQCNHHRSTRYVSATRMSYGLLSGDHGKELCSKVRFKVQIRHFSSRRGTSKE